MPGSDPEDTRPAVPEDAVSDDSTAPDESAAPDEEVTPTRPTPPVKWTGSAAVPPPVAKKKRRWLGGGQPDPTLQVPDDEIPTPVDPWAHADPLDQAFPPAPLDVEYPRTALDVPYPPTLLDAAPPRGALPPAPPRTAPPAAFPGPPTPALPGPPAPALPGPHAPANRAPATRPPVQPRGVPAALPPAHPQAPPAHPQALAPVQKPSKPPKRPKVRKGPPPPPQAPPGYPPGYPPAPPAFRRRRRKWPWFLLFTLACCCGCPAYFGKPMWEQYPASAALPAQVADLRLRDDSATKRTTDRLEAELRTAHWLAEDTFAGVYADRAGKKVTVFGTTGFRFSPESDLQTEMTRLTERYRLQDLETVDTGTRGEYLSCGVGKEGNATVAVCGWADHGSLATAVFTRRSASDSAGLLEELREAIVSRQ